MGDPHGLILYAFVVLRIHWNGVKRDQKIVQKMLPSHKPAIKEKKPKHNIANSKPTVINPKMIKDKSEAIHVTSYPSQNQTIGYKGKNGDETQTI